MSRLTVSPLAEHDPSGGRVKITAPYGDGRGHKGVDWGTTDGIEVGTTLYAPVDGWLENTGDDGPYTSSGGHTAGRWLWWRGNDGTRWKMFHLNKVTVGHGTHAPAGSPIAEVGNTGTQAAHLHLEEHVGSWGNPIDFTNDAYEVIEAGRWPGHVEDDMTEQDFQRIEKMINDSLAREVHKWAGGRALVNVDGKICEMVHLGDGSRALRHISSPEEITALKALDEAPESGEKVVTDMPGGVGAAIRRWPIVY